MSRMWHGLALVGLLILQVEGREIHAFDTGWRFALGECSDGASVDCNDGDPAYSWCERIWKTVALPHDFQINLPCDENYNRARGYKPMCEGWYRKHFLAEEDWRGRRVSLDFGGIMCVGEVYLNGMKLAECHYGYLGFDVPIEGYLRFGETNVVAVHASTGPVQGARWYTGGGLYRSVRLIVRDRVSFSRHGIFIETPIVGEESAVVRVSADVDGWMRRSEDLVASVVIRDREGRQVAAGCAAVPKDVRLKRVKVTFDDLAVESPRLWSVEAPHLYTAEVALSLGGRKIDAVAERFGFRSFDFSPREGFKLNGRKVYLKAMCNHHDLGALGAAAYPRAIRRQFEVMKEFGFNAIRCSHNPYSEEFYALADELGIIVIDEFADKWSGLKYTFGHPVTEDFFALLTEWTKRTRNRPSVVLRSLGNELQHDEQYFGFPSDDWGITTYRIFDAVVKRWDPSRPTTVAMYPARAGGICCQEKDLFDKVKDPPELSLVTDVACFNYKHELYPDYLAKHPEMIIFQSEAAVLDGLKPYCESDRARMVGLSYWGAIAYWGESQGWPAKGWDNSFFDHDLTPRPSAWLIRSVFRPEDPVLRLAVDEGEVSCVWNDVRVGQRKLSESWNFSDGSRVDLLAYSNADEVEVFMNGESMGKRSNLRSVAAKANSFRWDNIEWKPGSVVAVARRKGVEIARHELATTGVAVKLEIEDEPGAWRADGKDLKYVWIKAVDAQGRVVLQASDKVRVEIEGPAELLALDDGDQCTNECFATAEKKLRRGRLLAILRADTTPGMVGVRVFGETLEAETRQLVVSDL